MNKIIISFLIALVMVPGIALSGEAYLPYFKVDYSQGTLIWNGSQDFVVTDIHITNISKKKQQVSVLLYNNDGAPLENQPVSLALGSDAPIQTITNSDGTVSVDLKARSQCTLQIQPVADVAGLTGYGIIVGKTSHVDHDKSNGHSLLAHAVVYGVADQNGFSWMQSISFSVPVNGGNPF